MDPYEFLLLILPLAALIVILAVVVYRLALRDSSMRSSEMKMLNELMQMGALDEDNFATALQGLLSDKVIDKGSFERLGKLIEGSFDENDKPVPAQKAK